MPLAGIIIAQAIAVVCVFPGGLARSFRSRPAEVARLPCSKERVHCWAKHIVHRGTNPFTPRLEAKSHNCRRAQAKCRADVDKDPGPTACWNVIKESTSRLLSDGDARRLGDVAGLYSGKGGALPSTGYGGDSEFPKNDLTNLCDFVWRTTAGAGLGAKGQKLDGLAKGSSATNAAKEAPEDAAAVGEAPRAREQCEAFLTEDGEQKN